LLQIINRRSSSTARSKWCLGGNLMMLEILYHAILYSNVYGIDMNDVGNLIFFRLNNILSLKALAGIPLLGRR
jgi:hypothetical protein